MSKELIHQSFDQVKHKLADTLRKPPETRTGLIWRNDGLHKVTDSVAHLLTKELRVHGEENLETVRDLLDQEKRIALVSRHESHLDAVAVDQSLEQAGYDDLATLVFHIFGIRLEEGIVSSWFADSQSRIRIWPPFDAPNTDDERALKELLGTTSVEAAKESLDMGLLINIFPEGTRENEKREMRKPIGATVNFFDEIGVDYILPVAIDGTQNILPRRKWPRLGSYDVTFCEPIDYHAVKDTHADLGSQQFKREYRQAVMYDIMKPIADVVSPETRGYFNK